MIRWLLIPVLFVSACPLAEGEGCEEREEGALLARISSPITLRPEVLRTREAVIGSLAADAFLASFNGERDRCLAFSQNAEACVDLAFQNAGGLRDETRCGLRSEWREGGLYQRDLEELMPFENPMQAIYVRGHDLLTGMELGVSLLGEPGRFAKNGAFLHLAGAAVMVDCGGKARMVNGQSEVVDPGARVLGICLRHWSAGGDSEPSWSLVDREATYTVATNSYIAGGGDGFSMLTEVDSEGNRIPKLTPISSPGTDQSLLGDYLTRLSAEGERVINPSGVTQPPNFDCPDVRIPLADVGARLDALAEDPSCQIDAGDLVCSFSNLRMTLLRSTYCFDFGE